MKTNYGSYSFTFSERIKYIMQSVGLCAILDYLFYKSWWALLLAVPFTFVFLRWKQQRRKVQRQKELNYQFKDALNSMNTALQAGYAVENAVIATARDLEQIYPPSADIVREFHYLENQLSVSVPVEDLFLDLGNRSQLEDIENFASVFATAKRTGGDMVKVIQKTAHSLGDKIDVKKEIESTIAAKRMEQSIMSLMPFAIILYMQLTSPGFLDVLYGNPFGVAMMSICLCIYFGAYWMGCRIVDIQV